MTHQVFRAAIIIAAIVCVATPAIITRAQEPAAPAQTPAGNPPPNDPFFRKPKPQAQAPKVTKPSEPVLIPQPTLPERQADFQRNKDLARQRGLPDPDPIGTYLVSELVVTGVFQTDTGVGAFIMATPTKTTFYVGPGTRVFNGDIKSISTGQNFDLGAVTFRETNKYRVKNKIETRTTEVTKPVTGPTGTRK